MISLEIAEYLSKKCKEDNKILVMLLENTLGIEIKLKSHGGVNSPFEISYSYIYNGNHIGYTYDKNTILVMNLWKYLDENQRQKLAGIISTKDPIVNLNIFQKNTNSKTFNNNIINNIFIVYGHDLEFKESIKDKINAFNNEHEDKNYRKVKPVLFEDEFTNGKTIIETLEKQTEKCNYAIILLTPDDDGKNKKENELQNRARQNVILEWGWFVGTVGRENVLVLVDEADKLELPSDFLGLKWASKKAWRAELEKFLKHISDNSKD